MDFNCSSSNNRHENYRIAMVLVGVFVTFINELRQYETLIRILSLRGENMIDLRNTCILVRTKEENEMLLKEAEKQGFYWINYNNCQPLLEQHFPDILKFYESKDIVYRACISSNYAFYEASDLLGTKEMTAREFIKWYVNADFSCGDRACEECVLGKKNTKCKRSLCYTCNWGSNIDELLEIAKTGRIIALTSEEKAIENIEKFIENPDRVTLNDEFVGSLKLAVERLKEVENG